MKEHWNEIYAWMDTDELGWYEEFPEPSLRLISRCNINKNEPILDVGTGSSTLIDNLISQGFKNIVATDISDIGIEKLKKRLENSKVLLEDSKMLLEDSKMLLEDSKMLSLVKWIIDDITNPIHLQDLRDIAIWHDRALLHFLLKDAEQRKYLSLLNRVIKKDGYVIIATFSLKGLKKCAGLNVKNYDHNMLKEFLGENFDLVEYFDYVYHTPSGTERPYIYTLFQKVR
jgi:hypothetical protein